jgi:hypothetical protein
MAMNSTTVLNGAGRTVALVQKGARSLAPEHVAGNATAQAEGIPSEGRRRSRRVLLRIRAHVHVNLKGKQATLEVRTLSVNPYGAMIIAGENLLPDTRLVLENALTREKVACRVVRSAKEMPEGFHVPIEFDVPAPHFWMIDFPPDDWKPVEDM